VTLDQIIIVKLLDLMTELTVEHMTAAFCAVAARFHCDNRARHSNGSLRRGDCHQTVTFS
jgi:hypothetical protein